MKPKRDDCHVHFPRLDFDVQIVELEKKLATARSHAAARDFDLKQQHEIVRQQSDAIYNLKKELEEAHVINGQIGQQNLETAKELELVQSRYENLQERHRALLNVIDLAPPALERI
jgi:hypothetical protein